MDFKSVITKIKGIFDKDRVSEQARVTIGIINEVLKRSYKDAVSDFGNKSFSNAGLAKIEKDFMTLTGSRKGIIQSIYNELATIEKNLEYVSQEFTKTSGDTVVSESLNYHKGNLVQFVEFSTFYVRYATKLLTYIYTIEAEEAIYKTDPQYETKLVPFDIKYIEGHALDFASVHKVVTTDTAKLAKVLSEIPDINIHESDDKVMNSIHGGKLDPMAMRLIITAEWNPFLWLGRRWAEYQHTWYTEAKDELRYLMLRRLQLEKARQGKQDAKLERDIDTIKSRIDKLNSKINEYETEINS